MKLGRNEFCHCGSGKKYKKCHSAQDEANARSARPRLVERGDNRFLVGGTPDRATLEVAEQYFAERDAGRGPAQQMMDFAQPLIESSDGTADGLNKAMSIAMVFWNLAITREEDREEMMTAMLSKDADPEVRSGFLVMAQMMIARHEAMFPELHNRR
jgi:SEC-C motif